MAMASFFASQYRTISRSSANLLGKFGQGDPRKRLKQVCLSNRKLFLAIVAVMCVVLYLFPSYFGLGRRVTSSEASKCLSDALRQWETVEAARWGASVRRWPVRLDTERPFAPFVGNGYVGVGLLGADEALRIAVDKAPSLPTRLHPLINPSVSNGLSPAEAIVTNYQTGVVKRIRSYHIGSDCVTVTNTVFAHRKYPSLLVQDISVSNTLDQSLQVEFSKAPTNGATKSSVKTSDGRQSVDIESHSVAVPEYTGYVKIVSTIETVLPTSVTVKSRGAETFRFNLVIAYSEGIEQKNVSDEKAKMEIEVLKTFEKISKLNAASTDREHEAIWRKLGEAGFGLSYSRAPETLNADRVNATRYAVLSNVRAPLHEELSAADAARPTAALAQTELCYNSHNTLMYPSKLWDDLSTTEALVDLAFRWLLTLEKHGCMHLVSAGADGVAQAMMLSFGGLKFVHHHLEFNAQPADLHRNYEFRNIRFDEATLVSIWVEVGDNNKAVIYTSTLHAGNKPQRLFACDAACLDKPLQLSGERTQFPVKLTDPITPILYITSDRSHLEQLKHTIHVKEVAEAEAIVTNYQTGVVKRIRSYHIGSDCVTVTNRIFAHRKYPGLLVQDISVSNTLDQSLQVEFSKAPTNGATKSSVKTSDGRQSVDIESHSVAVPEYTGYVKIVSTIETVLPTSVTVKSRGAETFRFNLVIAYSEGIEQKNVSDEKAKMEIEVLKTFEKISKLNAATTDREHEAIWRKLGEAGFGLSYSRAPETLNADRVNATRYAVLSNVRAPLHEELSAADAARPTAALAQTELCYNSHNTLMYPSKLWDDLSTTEALVDLAFRWLLTLEKHGCMHLVSAGADGVAQAMMLSFGGLKFVHHHLEFNAQPADLHRNYEFRNIRFDEATLVSIWVEVGDDNKAVIYTSTLHAGNKPQRLFACDAACLDKPLQLSGERTQFPVKLTDPITPILYITSDRSHLEQLKHTIHVKEVAEAPAHEHHLLALHRHGHRLGGLPTLFWFAIALLIITFHLFLFRLIYNEWCGKECKREYPRVRYAS